MESTGALQGIRVLDFSSVLSGPFATMLLADLGAEVVRVERPDGGDALRHSPPQRHGESAYFFCANRNKKSIVVDVKAPPGLALIRRLLPGFDVVVENFRPGVMARLGLAYDDVCALRPDVVYASMSAFGQDSPWRDKPGFELIAQALAGMVSVSSEPGRPPAKIQPQVTDLSSGMLLCIGILGALQHRARTGEGQWVQASLFESAVALMTNLVSMGLFGAPVPLGQRSRNPQLFPSQAFRTADGHVAVVCTPDHWPRFCRALGRAEWIAHPDYARLAYRVEHYDAMEAAVEEILRRQPTAHWVAALEREQVACAPIQTVEEMFAHPLFQALGIRQEVRHSRAGVVPLLAPPIHLSRTDTAVFRAPPALGEHTREVLEAAGLQAQEIEALLREGVVRGAGP